jgi:hypothetical protein
MRRKTGIALGFLMAASLALLTACGGDDGINGDKSGSSSDNGSQSSGSSGNGGDQASPQIDLGYVDQIGAFHEGKITLATTNLAPGESSNLRVDIVGSDGQPYRGKTIVYFTSNCASQGKAQFSQPSITTKKGKAVTTYTNEGCKKDDTVTAMATANPGKVVPASSQPTAGGTFSTAPIRLGYNKNGSFHEGKIHVGVQELLAGDTYKLHVDLVNSDGHTYKKKTTVQFDSKCAAEGKAKFSPSSVTTKKGKAETTYKNKSCGDTDKITATASTNPAIIADATSLPTASGEINDKVPPSLRMGYMGEGTNSFKQGSIDIGLNELYPQGTSGLRVNIIRQNNDPYTGEITVKFKSDCAENDKASFSQPSVTTTNGEAETTYKNKNCPGQENITAEAEVPVSGDIIQASGQITGLTPTAGRIEYIAPDSPLLLQMKTNSGVLGDATSLKHSGKVTFQVIDNAGHPVPDRHVDFSLNNTAGGTKLDETSGKTDEQGKVEALVIAGTVHTVVRVTATTNSGGKTLKSQSGEIAITTGIPVDDSLSTSVVSEEGSHVNQDATKYDGKKFILQSGKKYTIQASIADYYGTSLPDVVISFAVKPGSGGAFESNGQCKTDNFGTCIIEFRSSGNAAPANRVLYLATVSGAEHFTDEKDADGKSNGKFDKGEHFDDTTAPFIHRGDKGEYDPTEQYQPGDFGLGPVNGSYDSNQKFDGALCNDPENNFKCGNTTTTLFRVGTLIESTSNANISVINGPISLAAGGDKASIKIKVTDQSQVTSGSAITHYAMASGTTISTETLLGNVTIISGGNHTQNNDTDASPPSPSDSEFSIGLQSAKNTTSGDTDTLEVTVTSPSGMVTSRSFPIRLN